MKLPDDKVRYIDIQDVKEIFADSLGLSMFDGQTIRLELCVTRFDTPKPPKPPTARKYPACRLILTPELAVDLFNQLQNMMAAMHQAGLIKHEQKQSVIQQH